MIDTIAYINGEHVLTIYQVINWMFVLLVFAIKYSSFDEEQWTTFVLPVP